MNQLKDSYLNPLLHPYLIFLYEKYSDQGFVILDFPCNQFGNQAPGSDEEIALFCDARFGIKFP
ncbi:MAG TPA: hypothetical protein VHQ24_11455, partial [Lachnospiraceae bacterium]|nr:hypothetical protein [Lachnospiraceae bacterium]